MPQVLIAGSGIAGLSAAWHATRKGLETVVLEKDNSWGGLLDSFSVGSFRFDKAVHFAFSSNDPYSELLKKTELITHKPNPYNHYCGYWLKHPVQNNLYPLPAEDKTKALVSFINRPEYRDGGSYHHWLYSQLGEEIAERFPVRYTKKYWTVHPELLSTDWIGNRIYRPSLEEVLLGAMSDKTSFVYYLPQMFYPQKGSFKSILKPLVDNFTIHCDREIIRINPQNRFVECKDGSREYYDIFASSIPLPALARLLEDIPDAVAKAAEKLWSTSVALVSLGYKSANHFCYPWFYIYDEDIYAARAHSPHLKSPDNVPAGCSSIQFETYFSPYRPLTADGDKLIRQAISLVEKFGFAASTDLAVTDFRLLPYANVVFDHQIIKARNIVREHIKQLGILTIGRFGEWDYLWADQSYISGKKIEDKIGML